MIDLKINGESHSIPTSWEEVTYGQYCEILKIGSDAPSFLSIFTGIDCEIIKKSKIIGLDLIITALSFTNKPPKTQEYYDKIGTYKLPPNKDCRFSIQWETLAQFEDMRAVIKKLPNKPMIKDLIEPFKFFVAIYVQPIRDGEYSYEKAKEMVGEVNKMPALEVLSMGSFFFMKLMTSLLGITPKSPTTTQSRKKSKPVTTSSRKRSAATGRSRKRRSR
jgi:hypothetical protein